MRKPKEGDMVKITWGDAWNGSKYDPPKPLKTYDVGFIHTVNREGYLICSSRNKHGSVFGTASFLPRKMVTRVRILK